MRPSCWTLPAIFPPGHHMMVAGASVPSTVPRQMHMLGLMSTLERVIVSTLSLLSLTIIFAASWAVAGVLASLVRAYSTVGARGVIIMPTPMLAREVLARSTMDFCLSSIFMSAGAEWNTWFQSLPSWSTPTPCWAAARFTASTLRLGTAHISVLVSVKTWPLALPAWRLMAL